MCHDADALLAYRCCIKTGGFNLVALAAILRLAAHSGDALEVSNCSSKDGSFILFHARR